jgi:hypothetical protein
MAGVVASETVRAQTLQVFVCSQMNTADRPMLIRGCDITQDQARELEIRLEVSGLRPAAITDWIR